VSGHMISIELAKQLALRANHRAVWDGGELLKFFDNRAPTIVAGSTVIDIETDRVSRHAVERILGGNQ
jgi:hypothetical protein